MLELIGRDLEAGGLFGAEFAQLADFFVEEVHVLEGGLAVAEPVEDEAVHGIARVAHLFGELRGELVVRDVVHENVELQGALKEWFLATFNADFVRKFGFMWLAVSGFTLSFPALEERKHEDQG